jgi:hypothetical protein
MDPFAIGIAATIVLVTSHSRIFGIAAGIALGSQPPAFFFC